MIIVSKCCHQPIEPKHSREYPLGGRTWYIPTVVDICTGCGDERPEAVECCDNCGEVAYAVIETQLGGFCQVCVDETVVKV